MKPKAFFLVSLLLISACSGHKSQNTSSDSSHSHDEPYPDHLVFDHESGFFDKPFNLEIKGPKDYSIYYTLDNTDPDENSHRYNTPISIVDNSKNKNIYSVKQNISSFDVYYPSDLVDKCVNLKVVGINTKTNEKTPISHLIYFVGYQNKSGYENMPVISLILNDEDLFDYEKGIYVTGKIYDESEHTGYPETYPANYHQKGKEWERPANFKYFDKDKNLVLEQDIGVRIHGGWSRAFNQKSFNLYARKEYSGTSTFGYQFFGDINAHSLMIRSGGYRDTFATKIRDSLNQDFSLDEKFDVQRSTPSIVFLNGEYWGIYNLQERYSDNYVQEHHGIKKGNVLIIKNDEIDEGDENDYHFYQELKDFFTNEEFTDNSKYELAKSYIDMEEFASYMATQLYVGNIDWPANNVRLYRDISTDSKWHFMMFDTDDSEGMLSHMCGANIDPFLTTSHWKSGPLENTCLLGLMLSKLICNSSFKALFRNTFIRIAREKFTSTNVKNYLDVKVAQFKTPMVKNYHRFVNKDYNESTFLTNVSSIQAFFDERYDYAIGYLNTHIPE